MPPKPGGMNEQDYRSTIETEFLDRVYLVMSKWRRGKIKNNSDEEKLILWLVKEGLMAKDNG